MKIDISVNTTEVNIMLDGAIEASETVIAEKLLELCNDVVAEARSNLQNNTSVVTGDLLSSINVLLFDENLLEAEVGTTESYAVYVEYGRGWVRPVTKKVLRWVDKFGDIHFAAASGPAEPRPFLEPAVIVKTQAWAEKVHEALKEKIIEITGINPA